MSVRECIAISHPVDIEQYLKVLQTEFGAQVNPDEEGSYLIGDPPLPFYKPEHFEGHTYISGFNYRPLPEVLVIALAQHPELVPELTRVSWTTEQEGLFIGTLAEVRQRVEQEKGEAGVSPEREV